MSEYQSPHTALELGKNRMRELHQESKLLSLAREAQKNPPGRIRGTLNQVFVLLRPFALKIAKRLAYGRAVRRKAIPAPDQASLLSTHFGE